MLHAFTPTMYATHIKNMHAIFFQDWESQRLFSNDLSQQYTTTVVIAAVDTTYSHILQVNS